MAQAGVITVVVSAVQTATEVLHTAEIQADLLQMRYGQAADKVTPDREEYILRLAEVAPHIEEVPHREAAGHLTKEVVPEAGLVQASGALPAPVAEVVAVIQEVVLPDHPVQEVPPAEAEEGIKVPSADVRLL